MWNATNSTLNNSGQLFATDARRCRSVTRLVCAFSDRLSQLSASSRSTAQRRLSATVCIYTDGRNFKSDRRNTKNANCRAPGGKLLATMLSSWRIRQATQHWASHTVVLLLEVKSDSSDICSGQNFEERRNYSKNLKKNVGNPTVCIFDYFFLLIVLRIFLKC